MNEKTREEFEARASSPAFGLRAGHFVKGDDGEYLNYPTQCYLQVWQASRGLGNEPQLISYAEDMSTCTLTNGDGIGYCYDRVDPDLPAAGYTAVDMANAARDGFRDGVESAGKDANRLRWLRQYEFDIGSYHGVHEHNAAAWFEHISDENIDSMIADEAQFAKDSGHE